MGYTRKSSCSDFYNFSVGNVSKICRIRKQAKTSEQAKMLDLGVFLFPIQKIERKE